MKTKYPAPDETIARYDEVPLYMVVTSLVVPRHLGGMPTPALIEAGGDGKRHDAWRTPEGIWRLRDDAYDAKHKPADVEYTAVWVGRNPDYDRLKYGFLD